MGNLTKEYYMKVIDYYRPDYKKRILNGEYPMHLAKGNGYEITWVAESEISEYSIFNCPDEHFLERKSGEYFGWPITWHPNVHHTITPKKEYGRPIHLHPPFPNWTDFN